MLQRIQTIYLLLALGAAALIFVFPFCTYTSPQSLTELEVDMFGVDFSFTDEAPRLIKNSMEENGQTIDEQSLEEQTREFEKELDAEIKKINDSRFGMIFTIGQFSSLFLMLLILINIFLFRKRTRQIAINRFLILAFLLYFIGVLFGASYGFNIVVSEYGKAMKPLLGDTDGFDIVYGISAFLPAVVVAFLFLANFRIKKDERLVKSLDRLR